MSTYLQMPIAPNNPVYTLAKFKTRYLEVVGEHIQDGPVENAQGTHYLVGSSRLIQAQAVQLAAEYPMVTITDHWPVGWVTKEAQ